MSTMNRIANATNRFQGSRKRVLCVCSAGLLRSPTVAWILSNEPFDFNTRAAGSDANFALISVDEALIEWADTIVFVNEENEGQVMRDFDISDKHVVVLNIPDSFEFRDPTLVAIATEQLKKVFYK